MTWFLLTECPGWLVGNYLNRSSSPYLLVTYCQIICRRCELRQNLHRQRWRLIGCWQQLIKLTVIRVNKTHNDEQGWAHSGIHDFDRAHWAQGTAPWATWGGVRLTVRIVGRKGKACWVGQCVVLWSWRGTAGSLYAAVFAGQIDSGCDALELLSRQIQPGLKFTKTRRPTR